MLYKGTLHADEAAAHRGHIDVPQRRALAEAAARVTFSHAILRTMRRTGHCTMHCDSHSVQTCGLTCAEQPDGHEPHVWNVWFALKMYVQPARTIASHVCRHLSSRSSAGCAEYSRTPYYRQYPSTCPAAAAPAAPKE